jgi:hypothetical protein
MGNRSADAGLVHPGATGDVLCGTAALRANRGHHTPFGDIEPESGPIDFREMLAHLRREPIQAKGHEIA